MFRSWLAAAFLACSLSAATPAAAQFVSTFLDRPLTGERLMPSRVQELLAEDPTQKLRALADRFRSLALEYDGRDELGWKSDYDYRLLNSLTWSVHRNLDMKAMLATSFRKLKREVDAKRASLEALDAELVAKPDASRATERAALAAELSSLEGKLAVIEEDLVIQDEISAMLTEDIRQRMANRRGSGNMPAHMAAYHQSLETLLAEML